MSGGTPPTCQRLGGIWIASLTAKGSLSLVSDAAPGQPGMILGLSLMPKGVVFSFLRFSE